MKGSITLVMLMLLASASQAVTHPKWLPSLSDNDTSLSRFIGAPSSMMEKAKASNELSDAVLYTSLQESARFLAAGKVQSAQQVLDGINNTKTDLSVDLQASIALQQGLILTHSSLIPNPGCDSFERAYQIGKAALNPHLFVEVSSYYVECQLQLLSGEDVFSILAAAFDTLYQLPESSPVLRGRLVRLLAKAQALNHDADASFETYSQAISILSEADDQIELLKTYSSWIDSLMHSYDVERIAQVYELLRAQPLPNYRVLKQEYLAYITTLKAQLNNTIDDELLSISYKRMSERDTSQLGAALRNNAKARLFLLESSRGVFDRVAYKELSDHALELELGLRAIFSMPELTNSRDLILLIDMLAKQRKMLLAERRTVTPLSPQIGGYQVEIVRQEAEIERLKHETIRIENERLASQQNVIVLYSVMASLSLIFVLYSRARFKRLAMTDSLTKLPNRRACYRHLKRELRELSKANTSGGRGIGVLLIDVDFFKSINDTWGHHTGDRVLKELADIACSVITNRGVVGRFGGEEFCTIIRCADYTQLMEIANELREAIAVADLGLDKRRVTVSIGAKLVSKGLRASGLSQVDLIVSAVDFALYKAKAAGRNCVVAADRYERDKTEIIDALEQQR